MEYTVPVTTIVPKEIKEITANILKIHLTNLLVSATESRDFATKKLKANTTKAVKNIFSNILIDFSFKENFNDAT